jgi:hypothetical protein
MGKITHLGFENWNFGSREVEDRPARLAQLDTLLWFRELAAW